MGELIESKVFSPKLFLLGDHGVGHVTELKAIGDPNVYSKIEISFPESALDWPAYFAQVSEKYAESLIADPPDLLVVLGDRLELLAIAPQVLSLGAKIVHIHGGEVTEGAIDDSVRHAISKLTSLHFVATQFSCDVLESLGETRNRIHVTGALAVDNFARLVTIPKPELETMLGVEISEDAILVTFHPVTNSADGELEAAHFFEALAGLRAQILITEPNHDPGSKLVRDLIGRLQSTHPRVHLFTELGTSVFYSLLKQVKAVVGNSSSGIFDSVIAGTPSLDFGSRQKSRVTCPSVVRTHPASPDELLVQIEKMVSAGNLASNSVKRDFFGKPGVATRMVEILSTDDILFSPKWQTR